MNEEEARSIIMSSRKPLEAAILLVDEEIVLLQNPAGDWLRITVSEKDFDEEWNLVAIPDPETEPLADQFDMLLAAGDLHFQTPDEMIAAGGERILSHYASVENAVLAALVRATGARIVTMNGKSTKRWRKAKDKARYEIDDMVADHLALSLVKEMASDRFCAFPKDYGVESENYWYERYPIRTTPHGEVIVSRPRLKGDSKFIDYDIPHHARRMGLVGEILVDDEEVFVLTAKGFETAGVIPGSRDVVAPEGWQAEFDSRRRAYWTRIAEQQHVLVFVRDSDPYRDDEDDQESEPMLGWAKGDIVVGEPGSTSIAVERPGMGFQWIQRYMTAADPFTANEYDHVDELVSDLLAAGRHVTDLRRCIGRVETIDQASQMLDDGMVILQAGYGQYLCKPRENGMHGDLFEIGRGVHRQLWDAKMIVEALGFRSDYHRESLQAKPDHPLVAALKAYKSQKASARMPDTSPVLGHDDDGLPITENQVIFESYQKPVEGAAFNLLAPFDYPGGDEQYEIDQQVESVRQRRRLAKGSATH